MLLLNLLSNLEIGCFEIVSNCEELGDAVQIVLDLTSQETTLRIKPEEVTLWGQPTNPEYGLNSKLALTQLRERFMPDDFPGADNY